MPGRRLLYWAYIALAVALVAALFSFGGYARGTAAAIAEILFYVCMVVALIIAVVAFMRRGKGPAA
jgi:uncharacterized membrane protein YtjA (UPF0391 family)